MTTLAARARTVHKSRLIASAAETVTFRYGTESVQITGAVGVETAYQILGADGLTTEVVGKEWYLPQSECIIDSVLVEPRMNNQIVAADGRIYEPMKPGANQSAVVSHDGDNWWLVHTKRTVE